MNFLTRSLFARLHARRAGVADGYRAAASPSPYAIGTGVRTTSDLSVRPEMIRFYLGRPHRRQCSTPGCCAKPQDRLRVAHLPDSSSGGDGAGGYRHVDRAGRVPGGSRGFPARILGRPTGTSRSRRSRCRPSHLCGQASSPGTSTCAPSCSSAGTSRSFRAGSRASRFAEGRWWSTPPRAEAPRTPGCWKAEQC